MPGIASAATSVVIGYVAGGTRTIRVGAGGIMLPNHSPLVIAEQFGTLESLYPGPHRPRPRPRARHRPADDARAAPRSRRAPTTFPQDVHGAAGAARAGPQPGQAVQAVPGAGLERAALDPRLEPVRRAARRARSACRTRSRRTSRPTRCCRRSTIYRAAVQAVGAARSSRTRWSACNVVAADDRRRGAAAVHVARSRRSRNLARGRAASCRRRSTTSRRTGRPAEKPQASRMLRVLVRRLARDGARRARARSSRTTGADELMVASGDLRPRQESEIVRNRGGRRGSRFKTVVRQPGAGSAGPLALLSWYGQA